MKDQSSADIIRALQHAGEVEPPAGAPKPPPPSQKPELPPPASPVASDPHPFGLDCL